MSIAPFMDHSLVVKGLHNAAELWAKPCRASQDRRVALKSSDKAWSTGEGHGNPLQHSHLENPAGSVKKTRSYDVRRRAPQVGKCPVCSGEGWRAITNSSRKNEVAGPKCRQYSVVEIASPAQCTRTWAKSSRQRRAEEPGVLQSMGS